MEKTKELNIIKELLYFKKYTIEHIQKNNEFVVKIDALKPFNIKGKTLKEIIEKIKDKGLMFKECTKGLSKGVFYILLEQGFYFYADIKKDNKIYVSKYKDNDKVLYLYNDYKEYAFDKYNLEYSNVIPEFINIKMKEMFEHEIHNPRDIKLSPDNYTEWFDKEKITGQIHLPSGLNREEQLEFLGIKNKKEMENYSKYLVVVYSDKEVIAHYIIADDNFKIKETGLLAFINKEGLFDAILNKAEELELEIITENTKIGLLAYAGKKNLSSLFVTDDQSTKDANIISIGIPYTSSIRNNVYKNFNTEELRENQSLNVSLLNNLKYEKDGNYDLTVTDSLIFQTYAILLYFRSKNVNKKPFNYSDIIKSTILDYKKKLEKLSFKLFDKSPDEVNASDIHKQFKFIDEKTQEELDLLDYIYNITTFKKELIEFDLKEKNLFFDKKKLEKQINKINHQTTEEEFEQKRFAEIRKGFEKDLDNAQNEPISLLNENSNQHMDTFILKEADRLLNKDRAKDYGTVVENFKAIATVANVLLKHKGIVLDEVDIADINIAIKIAREGHKNKKDNLVDLAAYANIKQVLIDHGDNK